MPDYSKATPEEKEAAATRLLKEIEERDQVTAGLKKDFAALTGKSAPATRSQDDPETRAVKQETDSEMFVRLSSTGELTKLAAENPKRFEEICEAHRLAGERKLFQGALP